MTLDPAGSPDSGGADADAAAASRAPGADREAAERADAEQQPVDPADVDWEALRASAREVMSRAYVPYSRFPVGAAALVDDGRTVSGCNVENAAFGVALCAECGLVSSLVASGGGRLTAFTCVDRHGELLMPCGRCRQLLWEHGGPGLLVETARGVRTLADLLPDAFGPSDLQR